MDWTKLITNLKSHVNCVSRCLAVRPIYKGISGNFILMIAIARNPEWKVAKFQKVFLIFLPHLQNTVFPHIVSAATILFWNCKTLNLKRSIVQTFSKPDCCPNFLFLELETSNFAYLLIFWIPLTVQSFRKIYNIDLIYLISVPLWCFFDFVIYQKFKGGTLIKCLILLSNLAETLPS